MIKLLREVSKRIILLNEIELRDEQIQSGWIGNTPATDEEIHRAEDALQLKFPSDYIDFLKITNGFPPSNLGTGITFLPVGKIDYLKKVDEDLIEIWGDNHALKEVAESLSNSVLIGGLHEEQYFLLIPPDQKHKKWRYWQFASWIPGEWEFKNLEEYFQSELISLKKETKGLRKAKPKQTIDYGLRDYLFSAEWEKAFDTALKFLRANKQYNYFQGQSDLLKILLLSSSKLNCFDKLRKELEHFKLLHTNNNWLQQLVDQFQKAADDRLCWIEELNLETFVVQVNGVTKEEIEAQTKEVRYDLLKPKNLEARVEYQLHFYFAYGNADEFMNLYLQHQDLELFLMQLRAAIVFATTNHKDEARRVLTKYFEVTKNCRPLEPFLHSKLAEIMDEEFSKKILVMLKQAVGS